MSLRFSIFLFVVVIIAVSGEKRLLTNDPDTINKRLLYLESELQTTKVELQKTKTDLLQSRGVTYIQWGRKVCTASNAGLVYSGIAAGGYYKKPGAAANYVCLPHDPDLLTNVSAKNPYGAYTHIYGAEYEDDMFSSNLMDRDVPCAVCHVTSKSSILMIPGKNHCYAGWTVQYYGKLASGYEGAPAASEFVCVDSHPEVFEHSDVDQNGKLFYPVSATCGSLSCPPYINNAILTCAVCSK